MIHTVEIRGNQFYPATVAVNSGDGVVWVNCDNVPHTVTGSNTPVGYPPVDSGEIPPGGSFSLHFTEPGEFRYRCQFYTGLVGDVMVQ